MRIHPILNVLGLLLLIIAGLLLVPFFTALIYSEGDAAAFLETAAVALGVGLPLRWFFRHDRNIRIREGFVIVNLSWVLISTVSALPFIIHGSIHSFTDAFFEVMSGFTTTGATILQNIEQLPHGLLLWRSMTHFIGGMGIVFLTLLAIPLLGMGNTQLYQIEGDPGQNPDGQRSIPRIQETVYTLWLIYVLLNVAETLLLSAGGMPMFDAICHAQGTIATGGFSTKNASLAHYHSAYFDGVVALFMFLGGLNFVLYYQLLRRKWHLVWKNTELLVYFGVTFVLCITVAWILYHQDHYHSLSQAIQFGFFQVISMLTTTGFVTADYEQWPEAAQMIIILSMFIGACSGSTTSGIRIIQWVIVVHYIRALIKGILQPLKVSSIHIQGATIDSALLNKTLIFVIANMIFLIGGACMMTLLTNMDVESAITSIMATCWNIGPGFGSVGAIENYASITDLGKWFLSISMMIGRLDIFTTAVLFLPYFWRK